MTLRRVAVLVCAVATAAGSRRSLASGDPLGYFTAAGTQKSRGYSRYSTASLPSAVCR